MSYSDVYFRACVLILRDLEVCRIYWDATCVRDAFGAMAIGKKMYPVALQLGTLCEWSGMSIFPFVPLSDVSF